MPTTPTDYRALALALLAPPASASAWDWCAAHLHLRGGRWDPRRAGLMRHWYDIATARISGVPLRHDPWAHRTEELYLVLIAQLAKTTYMQSVLAWAIANHPREMAWYGTRGKDVSRFRKRALVPMIESTAQLNALLPTSQEAREIALGSDLLQLGGSILYLLNANLLDDLRSLALPLISVDEFNRLDEDLEQEGDPIDLAKVRQRTLPHDRLLMASTTPSSVNGHGWRRLRSGSHERPLVICPPCQGADVLDDRQVCSSTELPLAEYPTTVLVRDRLARWACHHCGTLHNAAEVRTMVLECIASGGRWCQGTWSQSDDHPGGHWQPVGDFDENGRLVRIIPPETTIRSGWANALYSPDVTLDGFAAGMVSKLIRGKESEKRTWTNTEACRPWIHQFIPASTDDIVAAACRGYAFGSCPSQDCEWLVLTIDQQGNQAGHFWFPWVLRAWALGGESWLVAAGKAEGEANLDDLIDRLWPIGSQSRSPDLVAMDVANPNYRQRGYLWAAEDPRRRICLRGDSRLDSGETWREVPADTKRAHRTSRPAEVHEWRIHPHHWRTILHESMLARHGRPPWHLPSDPPKYYLQSLNAEDQTVENRRVTGGGFEEVVVWVPRITSQTDDSVSVRKDLHWADCEKMQCALADIFGFAKPVDADLPATPPQNVEEPAPSQAGFQDGVW